MSVITIPRVLREKFNDDVIEAFVEVINKAESSKDLATKADLSVEISKVNERITFEIGKVNERITEESGKLRVEIEKSGKENIKWMFLFWIGQIAAFIAIIKFMVVK